jgi:hypothetical protein
MTQKELKALLKLCRANGVQSIRYEGVEIHLGELPQKYSKVVGKPKSKPTSTGVFDPGPIAQVIDTPDEMTDEQLLFGSSDPSVWNTSN